MHFDKNEIRVTFHWKAITAKKVCQLKIQVWTKKNNNRIYRSKKTAAVAKNLYLYARPWTLQGQFCHRSLGQQLPRGHVVRSRGCEFRRAAVRCWAPAGWWSRCCRRQSAVQYNDATTTFLLRVSLAHMRYSAQRDIVLPLLSVCLSSSSFQC